MVDEIKYDIKKKGTISPLVGYYWGLQYISKG